MKVKWMVSALLSCAIALTPALPVPSAAAAGQSQAIGDLDSYEESTEDGNVLLFDCGGDEVRVELCTARTVRVQLSVGGSGNYRTDDPEYYMVQKNEWEPVTKTVTREDGVIRIRTEAMEIRIQESPFRIGMYDLEGNLLSKDADDQGMYWEDDGTRGVRKVEGAQNAGGIFGFGSGDHGRRQNLNRYNQDFTEFSMSHGRLIAPFFMSSVGYGIFLNTLEKDTRFFKQGGGFETAEYLDYYFMYGPDFKTILNEYAEITGRMELYGKWAHGFILSKYGNDNATQAEFLEWLHKLRDEGYPCDSYAFDYGWRGDVADNGGNQTGAGEKFGKQMWNNDKTKFPDIAAMFEEADELGFRVGLHNNAGTPEASGGKELYKPEYEEIWVKSYMDSVITTGYGDWFWPDEFDVLGVNSAPVFSSKGAYEAWQEYTDQSRPMFITRGSYAGQHYATAWSGDIENPSSELENQIGFSIDAGLVGYWAVSHDLGGFMHRPSDELYTRWVSEFGAWTGIMRTHGHDGREPWTYDDVASDTLKENLQIRYALYPYTYSLAWQGYSEGVPMMRAMLLEDGSQYNPDAWDLNQQYYYGDWFLVAPASQTSSTVVSVWLPPETTWYNYYTGERYEGGRDGKTINVAAALDEIPVFVKAGAIVPMGPDVDYADEKPLDPLTLDIYPHEGATSFTLYEDDGQTREYITQNAYSTTTFESRVEGEDMTFRIHEREDHNPAVYLPCERNYNLKFNHIDQADAVSINGRTVAGVDSLAAYDAAEEAFWLNGEENILYVKTPDTGEEIVVELQTGGVAEPELGDEDEGLPPETILDGGRYELENAQMEPVEGGQVILDTEWGGYTGTGFAKGFKGEGDAIEFQVDIQQAGDYNLVLRVNCGKKNEAIYDNSPRQGTMYLDGDVLSAMEFEVTPTWGSTSGGSKQGDWRDYTLENVTLSEGVHTFRFVAEGDRNPGNYNLDSLTFNRIDRSVSAFQNIEAESAAALEDAAVQEDAAASGGAYVRMETGGEAQYSEVRGEDRSGVRFQVRSETGGEIIVYENGVGDKVLATLSVPGDGQWHTLEAVSQDTDAEISDIWLECSDGTCDVDWFHFTGLADAYRQIEGETADERSGMDISNDGTFLNHIENGDWALFRDLNFAGDGPERLEVRLAAGLSGGTCTVYLDSLEGQKLAEFQVANTGSWNTFQTFQADCADVTGVHDVYFLFTSGSTESICDVNWLQFYPKRAVEVIPEEAVLYPGARQQFTAQVYGEAAAQTVEWSISGAVSADTAITADGLLTIGGDETAKTITVRAALSGSADISDTALVTITAPPAVTIAVTPETAELAPGARQQFTAQVYGEAAAQTVEWSIEGAESGDTAITADGLLTIGADETAGTLTVRAALIGNPEVSAAATVTVTPASQPVIPGDMDGNGRVDIADVMAACKVLARQTAGTPPTPQEIERGDLTGEGRVAIDDVMAICKIIAAGSQSAG